MRFSHRFEVAATLEDVGRFHRRGESLAAITPPIVPISGVEAPASIGEGDQMEFTLWFGPLPVRWVARITETGPHGFVDEQIRGPYASWVHRHSFRRTSDGGTEVHDEVQARLKRHPLWSAVGVVMWLGLPLLFRYRAARTRSLIGRGA